MPIYEYRCNKGHQFEVLQSMSDDPLERCQECRAPVERVFHPVAVHFKGSGFYNTDYGRKKGKGGTESGSDSGGESKGSNSGGKSKGSDSGGESKGSASGGDSKGSDSKGKAARESKAGAGSGSGKSGSGDSGD